MINTQISQEQLQELQYFLNCNSQVTQDDIQTVKLACDNMFSVIVLNLTSASVFSLLEDERCIISCIELLALTESVNIIKNESVIVMTLDCFDDIVTIVLVNDNQVSYVDSIFEMLYKLTDKSLYNNIRRQINDFRYSIYTDVTS